MAATIPENDRFYRDILGCVQYPLDAVIDWLADNKRPEDVFTNDQLAVWAEENGFERTDAE